MEFEYGKIAYLKMLELEKELSTLKNSLNKKTSNELHFVSENDDNNSQEYSKTFILNVIESGKYNFHGIIKNDFESENVILVNFYLNGQLVLTKNISDILENEYTFDALCESGKNELIVTFSGQNVFSLKYISVSLTRYESDGVYHRLSKIEYDGQEYLLNVNANIATIYKINESDQLVEILSFNCKDAQLCYATSTIIRLVYIDENSNLCLKLVEIYSNNVIDEPLNIGGVISVACYKKGDILRLIYTRFSQVYYCDYDVSLGIFSITKTTKKGNIVYSEPKVAGVYLIVDFTSKTKLVIE